MNQRSSGVTLSDVADLAGVSKYSASRALSGLSGVSAKTAKRVERAAEELNYVPNRLASGLRARSMNAIGVLTANSKNSYYSDLLEGIDSITSSFGFQSFSSDSTNHGTYDEDREDRFIRTLLELRVSGVVLTYQPSKANLELLNDWRVPIVFVDCSVGSETESEALISVSPDNLEATERLGDHFASHGYTHWLFVGHDPAWPSRQERELGFRTAAQRAGATVTTLEAGNSVAGAEKVFSDFLKANPQTNFDAFFTSNEIILNGSLRAIRALRPELLNDVGFASFDEFSWADLMEPKVTVIDQQTTVLGEIAALNLLGKIKESTDNPVLVDLPLAPRVPSPTLTVRNSCGCNQPE